MVIQEVRFFCVSGSSLHWYEMLFFRVLNDVLTIHNVKYLRPLIQYAGDFIVLFHRFLSFDLVLHIFSICNPESVLCLSRNDLILI